MTKSESNEMQLPAVFLFSLLFTHLSVKEPRVCDPLLWERQELGSPQGQAWRVGLAALLRAGETRGHGLPLPGDFGSSDGVGWVQDSQFRLFAVV